MDCICIVQIGKKYLDIDSNKGVYVLTDYIECAEKFNTLKDAMDQIQGTIEENKYRKQKKKILKYKLILEEEIIVNLK